MATIGQDTFIRANQSGWGTASDTQVWAHTAGTSTAAIASNEGTLTGVLNANDVMTLGPKTQADTDCLVRVKVTDTNIVPGVVFRCDSPGTTYYRVKNNGNLLGVTRVNAGTGTAIGTAVSATFNANTFYWLHARIVGSTITANWWADGGSEPGGWMYTATDSTPISGAGKFGLYANNSGAVSAATVSFDSFTATDTLIASASQTKYIPRALSALIAYWYVSLVARVKMSVQNTDTHSGHENPICSHSHAPTCHPDTHRSPGHARGNENTSGTGCHARTKNAHAGRENQDAAVGDQDARGAHKRTGAGESATSHEDNPTGAGNKDAHYAHHDARAGHQVTGDPFCGANASHTNARRSYTHVRFCNPDAGQ